MRKRRVLFFPMTLRLRLTFWYSVLLVLIILVLGGAIYFVLDRTLREQVDDNLVQTMDDVEHNLTVWEDENEDVHIQPVDFQPETFRAPNIYVQVWHAHHHDQPVSLSSNLGDHHAALDSKALHSANERASMVTINDKTVRVMTRPIHHGDQVVGHIQVAASLEPVEQATGRLLSIMLVGAGVAFVISLLFGNWLARQALVPISKVTRAAENISVGGDLSRRIPYNGPEDERGHLISTFNHMLDRLEKLFNSQKRFVSDVSHELRTPLTSIIGNVELAQRFGFDPTFMHVIESESQRMARIINDLLMLAQSDVGQLPLMKGVVHLDEMVRQIHLDVPSMSDRKVEIRLGPVEPLWVEADRERLRQLFYVLIDNAMTYTPEGGSLTISLRQVGNFAELKFADTGIGIPPEDLPHIFERFYRVDKARSREAGGTGLGLSIANWIVEAHGGTIQVKSKMGKGSIFAVYLPLLHVGNSQTLSDKKTARRRYSPGDDSRKTSSTKNK
jgi:heavy metal sensor kinase